MGLWARRRSLRRAELAGRGLAVARVFFQLVADLLTFVQRRQVGPLDGGDVHEHVLAAVIGLNETEAFLAVKPLHDTSRHISITFRVLSIHAPKIGCVIKFSERVEGGSGARSMKSGVESGRAKTIFD